MRDGHSLGTPSFQAEPLVLGVIGDVTKANLQSARPRLQHLRAIVETPRLTVMSNRRLPNWRSDTARGWFWHPIAKGVTPTSWIEAQNEAMAPGVAQQDEDVRLHNDRLGLHQLYYFETIDFVVFSNWLPILAQLSRARKADSSAWVSILLLAFPTPGRSQFEEIKSLPPCSSLLVRDGAGRVERSDPPEGGASKDPIDVIEAIRSSLPPGFAINLSTLTPKNSTFLR